MLPEVLEGSVKKRRNSGGTFGVAPDFSFCCYLRKKISETQLYGVAECLVF
jgi:hypothetical protein